jgi:hypothetical protein
MDGLTERGLMAHEDYRAVKIRPSGCLQQILRSGLCADGIDRSQFSTEGGQGGGGLLRSHSRTYEDARVGWQVLI